jgi:hypothetical protein
MELVDCKKRLFDDDGDDTNMEKAEDVVEIKQRSSVKKQKILCRRMNH